MKILQRRKRILIPAVAAVLLLSLSACAGGGAPASDSKTSLTVASQTPATSMDPVDAGGGMMPYFQAVYDTVIHREPDGSLTPWIATEWKYDDAMTALTLTLRDDVAFDDGTALDAVAVKANIERFRDGGGPESVKASAIESVEVVDATTAVIHLTTPDPALTDSLADALGLLANPAKFTEDEPFATIPDGTGPYTIDQKETIVGSKWVFERRGEWWGEELPFESVTYLVLDDENAIINGLKTGQVDAATIQGDILQLESDPGITLTPQEIDLKVWGFLDRTGELVPALGDDRVRQAINYAIDRETLVEKIQGGRGTATSQMWSPEAPGFDEALDDYYAYDPKKAKQLLAEAGYEAGFDLPMPRLTALVDDALAEALRTNLEAVGIRLTWEDMDLNTAIQRVFYQREFSGFISNSGQATIDSSTYLALIPPSPTSNPQGVTDPELDRLAAIVRTAEPEEAAKAAQEMNARLVELAWFAPLFRMEYQQAAAAGVTVTPQIGLAVPAIYNYAPSK